MPFKIVTAQPSDIPRLIDIEFAAYSQNAEAVLLRGRERSNEQHVERAKRRYEHMLSSDPYMFFEKAVEKADLDQDTPNETILGWIRWEHIQSLEYSRDPAHDFDVFPIPTYSEEDLAMLRAYWSSYEIERRDFMGTKAHCYVANIVVHPDHQRRGVATALLEHCLAYVDEHKLAAYLDASPEGRDLYIGKGFVHIRDSNFNMADYGRQFKGIRTHSVMIRDPR